VRFHSDAAIEDTPRGSYLLEVHAYDSAQATFSDPPVLKAFLPTTQPRPTAGVLTAGVLYASEPDASGSRDFESVLTLAGGPYMLRLRLTDPLGRTSQRLLSGNVEAIDPPNLADLRLRRNLRDLLIRFTSTTSYRQPPVGAYRLVISFVRGGLGGQQTRLLAASLHEVQEGDLDQLRTSPVTAILRSDAAVRPDEYGAVIKRFFPGGPFPAPPAGVVRVTLTAPDGTSAGIETDL